MAEAIAAFSLASNVIQVVDFGLKAASKCKEIYQEGSTSEIRHLERTSKELADLTIGLESSIKAASQPLTKDDHDLKDLSLKCSRAALDLQVELQKLSKGLGKRGAVIKFVKTYSHKRAIDELHRRLSEYQQVLNTRLLARLRYDTTYFSQIKFCRIQCSQGKCMAYPENPYDY